jgi:hypothetical protein
MNLKHLMKALPAIALVAGALTPTLSNASSVLTNHSHIGGAAQNVALATLNEGPGGTATLAAAIINSSGAIEVIAYNDSGTGIQRIGYASDAGGCCGFNDSYVAITTLDSTHVATAVVGAFGLLFVQTWTIGSDSVTETGSDGSSWGTGGLDFRSLAITAVSPSEVVTAARAANGGNLVVMDWNYVEGNGFENPINASSVTTGVVNGGYGNLGIVGIQSDQVAIAECDSNNKLKLIAWQVGSSVGYYPVRQGSEVVTNGCPVAVDINGSLNLEGGGFVSTASLAKGGAIEVAFSDVTPTTVEVTETSSSGWGNATQVAICGTCLLGGYSTPLTAQIGLNGNLWFGGMNQDSHIGVGGTFQSVAVAPEGLDKSGKFHFATAIVNSAGNVEIDSWKLDP